MTERETLLLSSGNGPGECRQAVARLLIRLAEEAALLGLDLDVAERAAPHGPASAVIVLTGTGAVDMARDWEGSILWRCPSSLRPRHPRKNWFAQIFRLAPAPVAVRIDPETVEMQAIRAGGPGGQHQNKTSSAIRARWVDPEGAGLVGGGQGQPFAAHEPPGGAGPAVGADLGRAGRGGGLAKGGGA